MYSLPAGCSVLGMVCGGVWAHGSEPGQTGSSTVGGVDIVGPDFRHTEGGTLL